MRDLLGRLAAWRALPLWLLGVGSPEQGDDGFGPRLAALLEERLRGRGAPVQVVDAGLCPERFVGAAARAGCRVLVFADAVDFGAEPGALLLAGTADLQARPPSTPTHRVPIPVLARYAESLGAEAWLLGVQPGSLRSQAGLSPPVESAARSLADLLERALLDGACLEATP